MKLQSAVGTDATLGLEPYVASASELIAAERGRRVDRQAELDLVILAWAARFAFVTVSTLAWRWGVSEQKMRKRVRRLEREGFVRRHRDGRNQPARVVVTERGGDACGLTIRTARGRESLGHELAVIKRVMAIELYFAQHGPDGARVLTERDMRGEGGRRWSVRVVHPHGRPGKRWPDYAVQAPEGTTAVELEFSLKATSRLRSIVSGYREAHHYEFVDFVLLQRRRDAQLWRSLTRLVDETRFVSHPASRLPPIHFGPRMNITPWRDPLPELHAGIAPFPSSHAPSS